MELRVEQQDPADVITMSGRLDLVSSSALKDMIRQRLTDRRANLVINLENVNFINSSGMGALISVLRDVRLSNGRMALCGLAPYLQEIFALTNLTRVFDCYDSASAALASFTAKARSTAVTP